MSRPIPNYLFHIPHMGNMIDYEELECKMKRQHPPEVVHVIDNTTKKRLGAIPSQIALIKYR